MILSTLKTVYRYISSPTRITPKNEGDEKGWKTLGIIYVCYMIILMLIVMPLMYLVGADNLDHDMEKLLEEIPMAIIFILAVFLAPLIEEFIFRFPLKFEEGGLFFILLFFGSILNMSLVTLGTPFLMTTGIITLLGLALFILGIMNIEKYSNLLKQNYGWIFYSSVILFAYAHAFNFDENQVHWYFIPILVLPQFFLALGLGYLRNAYSIWHAIALHALNNSIPMLAIIAGVPV